MTSHERVLVFTAAIRGFHVYRDVWKPEENEKLSCSHEAQNLFDMFAIKTYGTTYGKIVGHLPREISRPIKFLLDRGAKVTAQLTSSHYRKSPLFQGGLEIPCSVQISLVANIRGEMLIRKCKELVEELYTEPKKEVVGCFLQKSGNSSSSSRKKIMV